MKKLPKTKFKKYLSEFVIYKNKSELFFGIIFFFVYFSMIWIFLTSVPVNDTGEKTFRVEEGSSLTEISKNLKKENLIRSKTIFNILVTVHAGETNIISGEYLFTHPITFFELINRLTTGDYGIPVKQIRIPEGSTVQEIGKLFESVFSQFDKEAFYQLAKDKEGYLFPDTYFFLENVRTHEVLEMLEKTFEEKTKDLRSTLAPGTPFEDIVTMASIVEKEADTESRQEVSNILWKRIDLEKPLQVDATFVYSIGKGTFDLYLEDLQDEENPYNTYVHTGLPPTPISNPSLEALKAAAFPTSTPYLYFLTGHDGVMYYGRTFEEHKVNREKYL